jgi:hypothetical protein
MRAENVTGIANKVAKRDERAQELIHKAMHPKTFCNMLLALIRSMQ